MQHFTSIWKDILKALSFNADIIASDRELVIVFTEHVTILKSFIGIDDCLEESDLLTVEHT